jgi:hypothetical protein
MNERIKQLAISRGIYDCITDPYDKLKNGDTDSSVMFDLERFAELIIKECADLYTHDDVMAPVGQSAWGEAYQDGWIEGTKAYRETILDYFGVK